MMGNDRCPYCRANPCGCGALVVKGELIDADCDPNIDRNTSGPIIYNGYVCYICRDHARQLIDVPFYLGNRLVATVRVSMLKLRAHVPEGADMMPFIWQKFLDMGLDMGLSAVTKFTVPTTAASGIPLTRKSHND